jgi:hypothetical protein
MLAYYVIWHLKRAWAEFLFIDEDLEAKLDRDPVSPAQRSPAVDFQESCFELGGIKTEHPTVLSHGATEAIVEPR